MPRRPRHATGGVVYHVLNRTVRGVPLFEHHLDYAAFEQVLIEARAFCPVPLLDYAVMPNHWHLVLWPTRDGDLSEFMRWLTLTHTQRYHTAHGTSGTGPLYQGRFKSFPVQSDEHVLTVCRYVERNPLRSGLVEAAEQWRWGSLWRRVRGTPDDQRLLSDWPVPMPANWLAFVSQPQTQKELDALRRCVVRGQPYGRQPWVEQTARCLGLEATLRRRGRPRSH